MLRLSAGLDFYHQRNDSNGCLKAFNDLHLYFLTWPLAVMQMCRMMSGHANVDHGCERQFASISCLQTSSSSLPNNGLNMRWRRSGRFVWLFSFGPVEFTYNSNTSISKDQQISSFDVLDQCCWDSVGTSVRLLLEPLLTTVVTHNTFLCADLHTIYVSLHRNILILDPFKDAICVYVRVCDWIGWLCVVLN